jgi:hypothetical protein
MVDRWAEKMVVWDWLKVDLWVACSVDLRVDLWVAGSVAQMVGMTASK